MSQSLRLVDYGLTNPKQGAEKEMKKLIKQRTKLIEINSVDNNDYHSALTTIFILSWEENQNHHEVVDKLKGFKDAKELDGILDIISVRSMEGAFALLSQHNALINTFRQRFTVQQLEQILSTNKEYRICILKFNKKGQIKEVVEQKELGNKESSKAMFLFKNASLKTHEWVYMIYCTTQDQYYKDQQYDQRIAEEKRNRGNLNQSNWSQSQKREGSTDFRGSNNSNNSRQSGRSSEEINLRESSNSAGSYRNSNNSEKEELVYSPRSSEDGEREARSFNMKQQNPISTFCADCENFRVLDDKSKLCWQCFKQSDKDDYINILWYFIFSLLVIFLILLNYYHAKETGTIPHDYNQYGFINTAAAHSHDTIFSSHPEISLETYSTFNKA